MKTGKLATAVLRGLLAAAVLLSAYAWADEPAKVANRVKSGFLYNFAKFVEWPSQAFPSKDAPFIIGILGNDPIAADIEQELSGKTLEGRPLLVRRIPDGTVAGECHLLFICASEKQRLPKILETQRTRKILTVSDMDHFNEEGGMIGFRKDGPNIRFRINRKEAEKAGLKVSSKLLQLSK